MRRISPRLARLDNSVNDASERSALYYPYIHIRSEHWLKATLLCVPAVTRIVPEDYIPEDSPSINKYVQLTGPNGALLQVVPAGSPGAFAAQGRLLNKLRQHEDEILRRFHRSLAPRRDRYWIHIAKFNGELLDYLEERKLAWQSLDPTTAYGHRTWYALHPTLGSAIMTTLGLSIAREHRYDVVTPSTKYHDMLLASKEEDIFEKLLVLDEPESTLSTAQVRHDLGQLVIKLTGINYQALRPEDIPELQVSKHFRKFQHLIRTRAQVIDRNDDAEAYEALLKTEAQEIIDAWQDTKNDLGGVLKKALFDQALVLSGTVLKTHTAPGLRDLFVAGGVAISRLLIEKGLRFREDNKRGSPHRYLTEIVRAQNEFLRMTSPLGLEQ